MTEMQDLPITLPSLAVAVVRVPERMSQEDFLALITAIESWEQAIVEQRDEAREKDQTHES